MHQNNIEVELKLTVHDARVFEELAVQSQLGSYALRPAGTHTLRDLYWDTPAGDLANRDIGLRLRWQDGLCKFTFKRAAKVERGLFTRGELELAASAEAWKLISDELRGEGVAFSSPQLEGNPLSWLSQAGFQLTQDRNTERRVLLAELDGTALAEIALDTTTYHIDVYEVVFREVEVEALSAETGHVLAAGQVLEQLFPGRLSPSRHGKYSRGLDLAARLA